jgi:hypothetical protein
MRSPLPMRTPQCVLIVNAVSDRPIGEGSLVEVLLFDPWRGARSDIQAEYDLASLGEVESIHGPFSNPPRWMVCYKGEVSGKHGDRIQPKEQKTGSIEFGNSANGLVARM